MLCGGVTVNHKVTTKEESFIFWSNLINISCIEHEEGVPTMFPLPFFLVSPESFQATLLGQMEWRSMWCWSWSPFWKNGFSVHISLPLNNPCHHPEIFLPFLLHHPQICSNLPLFLKKPTRVGTRLSGGVKPQLNLCACVCWLSFLLVKRDEHIFS